MATPPCLPSRLTRAFLSLGATSLFFSSGLSGNALDGPFLATLDTAADRYNALAQNILQQNPERFPSYTTTAGVWRLQNDSTWVSGFLPGSYWYLYALTGEGHWQTKAKKWTEGVRSRATATDNDTGFQVLEAFAGGLDFGTSIDAADYTAVNLEGAKTLTDERWNPTIGAYRAWPANATNPLAGEFEVNVDMLMNMELILWAADNGGPAAYRDYAIAHADTTWEDIVRSDGSTIHVVEYDLTGAVINERTHQGWRADSTWSRGQAWAVYGYTMMYRYTSLPRMLDRAKETFDYFIAATLAQTSDGVPYSDFDAPLDGQNPRDSSAAAIVASAALELYTMTEDGTYLAEAEKILSSLTAPPYLTSGTGYQSLVAKASEKWGAGEVGAIFADFYLLESIWRYWEWIPSELGTWAGYPIRAGQIVQTGNWLGDINITWEPWIYSYDIGSWIYLVGSEEAAGGNWIYFSSME